METCDDILPIEARLFRGDQLFALRVHGDSMKDAGILPGDIAILRGQDHVSNGQVAAVVVKGEATLKRIFRQKDTLLLRAENPAHPERRIKPSEAEPVRIAGRLVGVVRVEGGRR